MTTADIGAALMIAAAVGSALTAGALFTFSDFTMRALRQLPAARAVEAMQAVNRTAVQPPFMGLFFGTAAAAAVARDPWAIGGAALYAVGVVGVTVAANVPLNDRLATLAPEAPDVAEGWAAYAVPWTRWNGVRVAAGIAAALAFVLGVR
jgi:uncharacterized membrane protein